MLERNWYCCTSCTSISAHITLSSGHLEFQFKNFFQSFIFIFLTMLKTCEQTPNKAVYLYGIAVNLRIIQIKRFCLDLRGEQQEPGSGSNARHLQKFRVSWRHGVAVVNDYPAPDSQAGRGDEAWRGQRPDRSRRKHGLVQMVRHQAVALPVRPFHPDHEEKEVRQVFH